MVSIIRQVIAVKPVNEPLRLASSSLCKRTFDDSSS
jgi:hypothetical protein